MGGGGTCDCRRQGLRRALAVAGQRTAAIPAGCRDHRPIKPDLGFVITSTSFPARKATKYFTELEDDRSRDRQDTAHFAAGKRNARDVAEMVRPPGIEPGTPGLEGPSWGQRVISSGYLLGATGSQVDQMSAATGAPAADLDQPLITDPRAAVENAPDSSRRASRLRHPASPTADRGVRALRNALTHSAQLNRPPNRIKRNPVEPS